MIFGDTTDFAIEAYHEPSGPKWGGFGRLCLHVQGVPIGDIRDNHCSLFDPTDCLRRVAETIESLWDERFDGLSDAELFRLFDNDIYSDEPPSELGSDFWVYDFLTNSSEMFNNTKTFVICRPGGHVHILYRIGDATFGSGACSVQSFRCTVEAYGRWFDEQVRTTAPPFFPVNPFNLDEQVPDDWNP